MVITKIHQIKLHTPYMFSKLSQSYEIIFRKQNDVEYEYEWKTSDGEHGDTCCTITKELLKKEVESLRFKIVPKETFQIDDDLFKL